MRNKNIYLIRFVAIFSVIIIHVSAEYIASNEIGTLSFLIADIYNSSARWSVPVFILLSGYLLLNKKESVIFFYQKRLNKILVPVIFWSLFYILWSGIVSLLKTGTFKIEIIYSFLNGKPYYHLWFIYMIVSLYIITPIARVIINKLNKNMNIIFSLGLFFIAMLDATYHYICNNEGNVSGFFMIWPVRYFCYFYLGGIFNKYNLINIISTKYLMFLALLGFLLTIVSPYYIDYIYSFNNLSVNVIIFSIAMFLLLMKIDIKRVRYLEILSKYSMGVYLVHPIFQDFFRYIDKKGIIIHFLSSKTYESIVYIPLLSIVIFLLSLFLVVFLSKIPLIKRVI